MDYASTVFRSNLGLEGTMFSRRIFPNLAIHHTIRWMQELAGLSFSLPEEKTDESTWQQAESLRESLNSDKHLADRKKLIPHIDGPAVLELGSGPGSFLKLIRNSRPDLELLVGVEFSHQFFNFAADALFSEQPELKKPIMYLARADITSSMTT